LIRNKFDRQLIKALAIGLSAGMLVQPVTVMAANSEGDESPENVVNSETLSLESASLEQAENADVSEAVEEAKEAVENASNSVDESLSDAAEAISNIAEAVKELDEKNSAAKESAENYNDISGQDDIDNANTYADAAVGAAYDAEDAAAGVAQYVETNAEITAQITKAGDASYSSQVFADAAKTAAVNLVYKASENLTEAQKLVEEASNAVETARVNANAAEEKYNDAYNAYEEAAGKIEAAEAELTKIINEYGLGTEGEYKGNLKIAIDSVNDALEEARKAADAVAAVQDAQSAASEKLQKVEQAHQKVMDMAGALEELKAQEGVSEAALSALESAKRAAVNAYTAAQKEAEEAQSNYDKAKEEADKAVKALEAAKFRVVVPSNDEGGSEETSNNDSNSSSAGVDETVSDSNTKSDSAQAVESVAVNSSETAGKVAGTDRSSNVPIRSDEQEIQESTDDSGFATEVDSGKKVEATIVDASETANTEETDKSTVDTVLIEEEETAKAATIEETEQKKTFTWWWLLIPAAITGVSAEEYARRKREKAQRRD
jgi:hypothetical protein